MQDGSYRLDAKVRAVMTGPVLCYRSKTLFLYL